jgi:hypothetical protein
MTKEEILEGNRLIAEFLGYIYIPYTTGNSGKTHGWVLKNYKLIDRKTPKLFLGRTTKDLLYHKSWDWLMPVVEKIESTRDYYVKIYGNQAYVQCKVMADTTILTSQKYVAGSAYTEENTKLSNTWSAIVEYIKFYNEKCSK